MEEGWTIKWYTITWINDIAQGGIIRNVSKAANSWLLWEERGGEATEDLSGTERFSGRVKKGES